MNELGGASGGGILSLIVAIAVFLGIAAPIVLSTGKGRVIPPLLAAILTVAAGAVAFSSKTSFDLILAVGIWIGGMIAGAAGYLQTVIEKTARNHAYRLIHLHDSGLIKPGEKD